MSGPARVIDWLLRDSDPSVRWRVYRELLDRPSDDPDLLAAATQIGQVGWAASILRSRLPSDLWTVDAVGPDDLYWPLYGATIWQLLILADLGATREDPRVASSAERFLDHFGGALGGSDMPVNQGPSGKLCVTGNVVRMMCRIGFRDDPRIRRSIEWLAATQLDDGGWNCDPAAIAGSLDAWEALAAFGAIPREARTRAVERAIERGAEFFLERALMHEGPRYEPWFRLHYPVHFYYDVLVGLDVLTSLGFTDDRRLEPALEWLESRRGSEGGWPLDRLHPDEEAETSGDDIAALGTSGPYLSPGLELAGHPSRWITTTALVVLDRVERG